MKHTAAFPLNNMSRLARGAALLAGLALLAAALAAAAGWIGRSSGPNYDMADVARAQPLEIGPGQAASFPAGVDLSSGERPRAVLSDDYYDFGAIGSAETVQREFLIRNQGQGDLVIQRAYTTCGCTVASISSGVVPPGQLAVIQVWFDPSYHDVAGTTVRRGLILETNDPRQPVHEIWVQAEVRK